MKKKLASLFFVLTLLVTISAPFELNCFAGATSSIVYQDLGTGAPPSSLGGYNIYTKADNYSNLQNVTSIPTICGDIVLDQTMYTCLVLPGSGWSSWSHGYKGRVYSSLPSAQRVLTLPSGVKAIVFYVEPTNFSNYSFQVKANDGTVYTKSIAGNAGAAGFGFYAQGNELITSITITAPSNANGFAIGEIYVSKKTSPAPAAPVLSATPNSITVNPVAGCEYSLDNATWTNSNTFTSGIEPNKPYTVSMRYKATDEQLASLFSSSQITTPKPTQSKPSAPIVSATSSSITVKPVTGCEYSLDNVNWTNSDAFTNSVEPNKQYTIYMRYKETNTQAASPSSSFQITTPKATKSAPPIPSFTVSNGKIIVQSAADCEYSLDNINWTTNNIFQALNPNSSYTVYMRYRESNNAYASQSSAVKITIPIKNPETDDNSPFENPFLFFFISCLSALIILKSTGMQRFFQGTSANQTMR